MLIHTLTPEKDCKEASDCTGESATKDAVEVGGHGAAPGLLSDKVVWEDSVDCTKEDLCWPTV